MTNPQQSFEPVTIEQAQAYADKYDLGNGVKLTARYYDAPLGDTLINVAAETPAKGGAHTYRVIRDSGDVVCVSGRGTGYGYMVTSKAVEKYHVDDAFREFIRLTHIYVGNIFADSYDGPLRTEDIESHGQRKEAVEQSEQNRMERK